MFIRLFVKILRRHCMTTKQTVEDLHDKIDKSLETCYANNRQKTIVNLTIDELELLESVLGYINQ